MSTSFYRRSTLASEAQTRRQSRRDAAVVSGSAEVLANHSGGSPAGRGNGANNSAGAKTLDAQAFNQAVKKFDETLNSLPSVAVVKF